MTTLANDTLTKADVQDKLKEVFSHFHGEQQELIPLLQETQARFRYLPADAMREIARFLHMPEATVYGVSTFYAQFKLTPLGKRIVRVCRGTACHVRGSSKVLAEMEKQLGVKAGETTEDREYTLETVACIGACALAPTMTIDSETYGKMTTKKVAEVLGDSSKAG
ncbi:MAG TPA: NADH-quinone oxidoreductase subunit NuoE [Dehalococcoidales bacterium]|nr:NADH-quinone oxidoreductase subunit NuoE [Dehalococcoidales bacterium]